MAEIYLALGSNLGDRKANLAKARAALESAGIAVNAVSSIYETEPWGPIPQGHYLNQVLRAQTRLKPDELLRSLHAVEISLGRDRMKEPRFGPRSIDLDILLYDDLRLKSDTLEIPHPRMMQRAFVLAPLFEIDPSLRVDGISVRDALERIGSVGVVRMENGD